MQKKAFPMYDFVVSGVKSALSNFRIFAYSTLIGLIGLFSIVVGFGATSFVGPLFQAFVKDQHRFFQANMTRTIAQNAFDMVKAGNGVFLALFFLIFIFFISIMYLGFIQIGFDLKKNGKSSIERLFSCFHLVPRFILASIIYFVLIILGLLFFIVPGVIIIFRLRFFAYYLVDKRAGIIESLEMSYRMTDSYTMEVFGLSTVAGVLIGLNFLVGFPIAIMMDIAAYQHLNEE